MKITTFGKRFIAFIAVIVFGLALIGCVENTPDPEPKPKTDLEKAQENVNTAIEKIVFVPENMENVKNDFTLASSHASYPKVVYTWTSSEEDIIAVATAENGGLKAAVTRPASSDPRAVNGEYVPVTLTAILTETTDGGEVARAKKDFNFKVICEEPKPETNNIAELKKVAVAAMVEQGKGSGDNVKELLDYTSEIYARVLYQWSKSIMISDGSATMIVYGNPGGLEVGDLVHVKGVVGAYYGQIQFGSGNVVTKLSEDDEHASIKVCAYEETTISEYTEKLAKSVNNSKKIVDADAFVNWSGAAYKLYAKVLKEEAAPNDVYALQDPVTGEKISIYHYSTDASAASALLDTFVGKYVYINAITIDRYSSNDCFRVVWDGTTPTEAPAPELSDAQKVEIVVNDLNGLGLEKTYYNGEELVLPTEFLAGVTVTWTHTPAGWLVDGKVSVSEDMNATLKATVTCGNVTETLEFSVELKAQLNLMTVAQVLAAAKGTEVVFEGTVDVLFSSYKNFFVYDETGSILVYATCEFKAGDKVRISGTTDVFNGTPQIGKTNLKVELVKEGTWTMQTPVKTTVAEVASWTTSNAKFGAYLQASGVLTKDSSGYFFLNDATDPTKKLSLYNSTVPAELQELAGTDKVVTLNFYFYGNSKADWSGDYRVVFVGRSGEYTLPELSDDEKVQQFLDKLTVPATLTDDFGLPTEAGLSWELAETKWAVLSNGTLSVTRPEVGEEDVTITLTATYTLNGASGTKEFTVTIKAKSNDSQSTSVKYVFANAGTSFSTTALTEEKLLALLNSSVEGAVNPLKSVVATTAKPVYDGNGSGGAFENTSGVLKMGKSKTSGEFTMVFDENSKAVKVEVKCYDWYLQKTAGQGTPESTLAVNEASAQNAPYNTTATPEVLTFEFAASNEVKFTSSARLFIFEITVYFE